MKYAFDLGNVLAHIDFEPFVQKGVDLKCFKTKKEGFNFVKYYVSFLDIGVVSILDVLNFNFKLTEEKLDSLYDYWLRAVYPNDEIFMFIQRMLANGHKVAILSNLGFEHVAMVRNSFPEIINQCVQHFSCEIGVKKPSQLFFKTFLEDNVDFKGCIFIDDRDENLIAAKKMQFKTSQFRLDEWENVEEAEKNFRIALTNVK